MLQNRPTSLYSQDMAVVAPITRARRGKTDGEAGARERILDAASRLFYAEGIQAVGIQRIIEQANTVKARTSSCSGWWKKR